MKEIVMPDNLTIAAVDAVSIVLSLLALMLLRRSRSGMQVLFGSAAILFGMLVPAWACAARSVSLPSDQTWDAGLILAAALSSGYVGWTFCRVGARDLPPDQATWFAHTLAGAAMIVGGITVLLASLCGFGSIVLFIQALVPWAVALILCLGGHERHRFCPRDHASLLRALRVSRPMGLGPKATHQASP